MSSIPQDITNSELLYLFWKFGSSGRIMNEIFKDINGSNYRKSQK